MRVLLVSHGAGPYGAERVLLELARRLALRGHAVVLDFPHPGPATERAAELGGIEVRVGDRRRLPRDLGEIPAYLAGGPGDILAIRRLVRDVAPGVTWVNSMYNPWAALGARLAGSPVVWHLHERSPTGPAGCLLAAVIGLCAARAVAVSEYAAESFRRCRSPGGSVRVLRNPLLREASPVGEPSPGPFVVGYVGQLEPRKRAPDLARAIGVLAGDVRAIFVGDGKDRAGLEAAVREVGVDDRVELVGYSADVSAQFGRIHCISIPSLGEGFGLTALEAMASGVPVVAARSGALPEVLGDAALYHEPGDASDLARQIDRLREDPILRGELKERGLRRASLFGPEAWLDTVEALLHEVASGDSVP